MGISLRRFNGYANGIAEDAGRWPTKFLVYFHISVLLLMPLHAHGTIWLSMQAGIRQADGWRRQNLPSYKTAIMASRSMVCFEVENRDESAKWVVCEAGQGLRRAQRTDFENAQSPIRFCGS